MRTYVIKQDKEKEIYKVEILDDIIFTEGELIAVMIEGKLQQLPVKKVVKFLHVSGVNADVVQQVFL